MSVPKIILEQLGGQKFIAMTGCRNFVGDKNMLRMTIPKNMSKANPAFNIFCIVILLCLIKQIQI